MADSTKYDLLDPANLAANQQGELTPAQRAYVTTLTGYSGCVLAGVASAGFAVLAICVVVALIGLLAHAPTTTALVAVGIAVVGGVLGASSVGSLLKANRVRQDLA